MMNNLQDAYTSYQHALYHIPNPKDPHLWYGIGLLYDQYGSLDLADEAFDAVLRIEPNFEKAREFRFRIVVIAKQRGQFDRAMKYFESLLPELPDDSSRVDVLSQI